MELLRERGLAALHGRLMQIVRSAKFTRLPPGVESEVHALENDVRELLVNTAETTGRKETPLYEACHANKEEIVSVLLQWGAQPTKDLYERLLACGVIDHHSTVVTLLRYSTEALCQEVFWLACLRNETHIGSLALSILLCPFENFSEIITTLSELVGVIHQCAPQMAHTRDKRVAGLFMGALCMQGRFLSTFMEAVDLTNDERQQIYRIFGASNVIANKAQAGLTLWKMAASICASSGLPESKTVTDIGALEHVDEAQTFDQVEQVLQEDELLVQALIVIEKCFGRGLILLSVLLARPYTAQIAVYTVQTMITLNKFTTENLQRLDDQLTKLGFYRGGKSAHILDLLDSCFCVMQRLILAATNSGADTPCQDGASKHDEQLLMDFYQPARGVLYRVDKQHPVHSLLLTEFIAKLILTLEWSVDWSLADERLLFVLRRVARACGVMNRNRDLLFNQLGQLHQKEAGPRNITQLVLLAKMY